MRMYIYICDHDLTHYTIIYRDSLRARYNVALEQNSGSYKKELKIINMSSRIESQTICSFFKYCINSIRIVSVGHWIDQISIMLMFAVKIRNI